MDFSNVTGLADNHWVAIFVLAALGFLVSVKRGFGPGNAL